MFSTASCVVLAAEPFLRSPPPLWGRDREGGLEHEAHATCRRWHCTWPSVYVPAHGRKLRTNGRRQNVSGSTKMQGNRWLFAAVAAATLAAAGGVAAQQRSIAIATGGT